MSPADEIRANVASVEARIASACARAGRSRGDVTLIAVAKTFPASAVDAVVGGGLTDIGENRVQEARDKRSQVTTRPRWHLIGHLQSNKAKDAVRIFDVIHSVDSFALGEKIARASEAVDKKQEILVQINIGRESQKSGVEPQAAEDLVSRLLALRSLEVIGIMAIPPAGAAEEVRPWFRELRELRERLRLQHVSMGMSEDFETAIEEGSTMVRIGRAIFGSRE